MSHIWASVFIWKHTHICIGKVASPMCFWTIQFQFHINIIILNDSTGSWDKRLFFSLCSFLLVKGYKFVSTINCSTLFYTKLLFYFFNMVFFEIMRLVYVSLIFAHKLHYDYFFSSSKTIIRSTAYAKYFTLLKWKIKKLFSLKKMKSCVFLN